MKVIICDIDGTVADTSTLYECVQNGEWSKFNAGLYSALPIDRIVDVVMALYEGSKDIYGEVRILFSTARDHEAYDATKQWLNDVFSDIPFDLYCRPEGCYASPRDHKEQVLIEYMEDNDISEEDIIMAFDDDADCYAMYRSHDICTILVGGTHGHTETA